MCSLYSTEAANRTVDTTQARKTLPYPSLIRATIDECGSFKDTRP